jgi:hypothetical protein
MRTFGIEISGNPRISNGKRSELTNEERATIVVARTTGIPYKDLVTNF